MSNPNAAAVLTPASITVIARASGRAKSVLAGTARVLGNVFESPSDGTGVFYQGL